MHAAISLISLLASLHAAPAKQPSKDGACHTSQRFLVQGSGTVVSYDSLRCFDRSHPVKALGR
jgi:hypothetical protein